MDDRSGPKAQETAPEGQEVAPGGATHRCRKCGRFYAYIDTTGVFLTVDGKPACNCLDEDPVPLAATAAGQEVPSALPPQVVCDHAPNEPHPKDSSVPSRVSAHFCLRPRPALPEEVVCEIEKTPHAGRHMDGLYPCVDPRPAHPPDAKTVEQKQLSEKKVKTRPEGARSLCLSGSWGDSPPTTAEPVSAAPVDPAPHARSATPATPAEPEKLGDVEALRAENTRLSGSVAQFDAIVGQLIVQLRDAAGKLDGYLPGYARDYRAQADGFTVARRVALPPTASPNPRSAPSAGPSTLATKGD